HLLPLAAAMISPDAAYSTSSTGTLSARASAVPSSTGTPLALPLAGSRRHQSADAAGPTAIATRSLPVGASSLIASSAAAPPAISMINAPTTPIRRLGASPRVGPPCWSVAGIVPAPCAVCYRDNGSRPSGRSNRHAYPHHRRGRHDRPQTHGAARPRGRPQRTAHRGAEPARPGGAGKAARPCP